MLHILPLSYNSSCIGFAEWISILTLCLAPLIAHIISGSGKISYLTNDRPAWHERLSHYNPTSIMWRYAAIADRRIRATSWDNRDLAACNAVFWTAEGWDGSEQIIDKAMPYCTLLPDSSVTSIFSAVMFETLITTVQGVTSLYVLADIFSPSSTSSVTWTVDAAFYPLAEIGLLRTFAALWLTDDFSYVFRNELPQQPPYPSGPKSSKGDLKVTKSTMAKSVTDAPASSPLDQDALPQDRYKSSSWWPSLVFRSFYLSLLLGLWLMSLLCFIPLPSDKGQITETTSVLLITIFYLYLLTVSTAVCGYYFVRGNPDTILPCISTVWYKLYTLSLLLLGVATIVLASIEINQIPGGYHSTPLSWSGGNCMSLYGQPYILDSTLATFGVAVAGGTTPVSQTATDAPTFTSVTGAPVWVYNFTGMCLSTSQSHSKDFRELLRGSSQRR